MSNNNFAFYRLFKTKGGSEKARLMSAVRGVNQALEHLLDASSEKPTPPVGKQKRRDAIASGVLFVAYSGETKERDVLHSCGRRVKVSPGRRGMEVDQPAKAGQKALDRWVSVGGPLLTQLDVLEAALIDLDILRGVNRIQRETNSPQEEIVLAQWCRVDIAAIHEAAAKKLSVAAEKIAARAAAKAVQGTLSKA